MKTCLSLMCICYCLCACRFEPEKKENPQAATHAATMDSIRAFIDAGNISRAQSALDQAFADGFKHPMAYFLQGRISMSEGDAESAAASIPWFEKAITASPGWVEPRLLLAQACIRDNRLRRAEQLFHDIDTLIPHSATGPYGLGLIDSLDGLQEQAVAHIDEALKRSPDYGPAIILRAQLAGKQNQEGLQRSLYERYIAIDPQHAGAHLALGKLYQKNGRLDDAWRSFKRSYALQANSDTARLLAELANLRNDQEQQQFWLKRAGVVEQEAVRNLAK